jgi:hypothetical protein
MRFSIFSIQYIYFYFGYLDVFIWYSVGWKCGLIVVMIDFSGEKKEEVHSLAGFFKSLVN